MIISTFLHSFHANVQITEKNWEELLIDVGAALIYWLLTTSDWLPFDGHLVWCTGLFSTNFHWEEIQDGLWFKVIKYFKHQQKDAPLIEIIHWKPLKFLQSSAITVDWLYFVYNVTRASMDAIQWCRRGVEQFEYTAHSQLNTFSLLRNKQFCWATDSFNIDVAHAYFVRPWSSSDRLSSHIGNLDYLDNKNLFLVPLFCAAKSSV